MSRRDRQHTWRGALVAGGAFLLWPWCAEAHHVTTGLGPVYDGVGHLLVTPEDLLPVLALALCAGLRGAGAGRRVLIVLPSAWLVGGCAGLLVARAASLWQVTPHWGRIPSNLSTVQRSTITSILCSNLSEFDGAPNRSTVADSHVRH